MRNIDKLAYIQSVSACRKPPKCILYLHILGLRSKFVKSDYVRSEKISFYFGVNCNCMHDQEINYVKV